MFGDYRSMRWVLKSPRSEAELGHHAERKDWRLIGRTFPDAEMRVNYEVVWMTDDAVTFHYVEDEIAAHSFVFFKGREATLVDSYADEAGRELEVWQLEETVRAVDAASDPRQLGLALLRMGLAAPYMYNEAVSARLLKNAEDPEDNLRNIAVWAMSYSPYPQYRATLRRLAVDDPNGEIRDLASATLRAFDEGGVPEL